jgi:hypothetical protein
MMITKEENNTLKGELEKVYEHLQGSDNAIDKIVTQKDEEIGFLNTKLVEFEGTIKKYSENLANVKVAYDKSIGDYKKALAKKNEEHKVMKEHYERIVKDVKIVITLASI